MTPRERVLAAVDRKRVDRTPADYHALSAVTERLAERLGVADREELLRALSVDMRRIRLDHNQPDSEPDSDGYVRNMWGVRTLEVGAGNGRQREILPFEEGTTVDDVHSHPWPDPAALDYLSVRPACEEYYPVYATYGAPWCPFFHEVGWIIGQENFFVWMVTKPEVVRAIIDHLVDYEVEVLRRFLGAAGGMIDITYFGNDFGTQRGLFISPQMWQDFIRKPLKRFYDVSHEYGCRVMQHSCGAVRQIVPALIADGLDVLDPIQVGAAGMDLRGLVSDYGGDLCFHGGIDTQETLPLGTTADVRAEVRERVAVRGTGGGYILCGSQAFMEDVPLDNILALYDENRKS
jgi:uroporphyrinogen decarboxylase